MAAPTGTCRYSCSSVCRHLGISSILKSSRAKTLHPFQTIFFLRLSSQLLPPASESVGMSPEVMGQERAFAEKWSSDFTGVLVLVVFFCYLVLWSPGRHALFSPINLLYIFHKLKLQDVSGLRPVFLLPSWVLFPWDLSRDGTEHHDTSAHSGQE